MRNRRNNRTLRCLALALSALLAVPCPMAWGQEDMPEEAGDEQLIQYNFKSGKLEQLVQIYARLTNRTVLQAPEVEGAMKKNFTAFGSTDLRLTKEEAICAFEGILSMHGIALVPIGTRFLKVVPIAVARQEGMSLRMELPEEGMMESDRLVSQLIQLTYIDTKEALKTLSDFKHAYGKILPLERTNSLLITDSSVNIKRILEIIGYLDRPAETRIRPFVIEIQYAKASEIASKLGLLIEELKEEKTPEPVVTAPRTPPGVIRARESLARARAPAPQGQGGTADRDVLQGKVKVVPDDRTNILIVITREENMAFIEEIVKALDVQVDPDLTVEIVFLEYAEASEVSALLSSLIGGSATDIKRGAASKLEGGAKTEDAKAKALREYAARARAPEKAVAALDTVTIGQLSSAVKIISDKRTNSLLISGSKTDLKILTNIIAKVDIMLAQVLIEVVIMEIGLDNDVAYGIDWLQRSMVAFEEKMTGEKKPIAAFAGGSRQGPIVPRDATALREVSEVGDAVSGLTYYLSLFDYPIDMVLRAVSSSGNVRILSTPIIMTTDNKEASITVAESRPVVTSTSSEYSTTVRSTYEYKEIGIILTVTPHINTNGFVVMDVNQSVDNVAGVVSIGGDDVPVITKRQFKASIAIANRGTVVLGGLVSYDTTKSRSKIPFLGDIPILGIPFRHDSRSHGRREVLVLITPYVLTTNEETETETARRKNALSDDHSLWERGWSDSKLAAPPSEEDTWFLMRWWNKRRRREF